MSTISQVELAERGKKVERKEVTQKSEWRKYLPIYLSIAPFYIVFLCFGLIPTFFSLYLAFQRWDGIGPTQFIGINNFRYAFTDPIFGQAIINTFEIWIISTIPMLFFALLIAFLLNQRRRSKFLYQVCYFLPYITSIVAIALIFGSFYASLFNDALSGLHLPAVQWLSDAWPMRWAVALMVIWRWTGYNALLYTAGLQSIPNDFYEAARIDGAGTRNIFFNITLPLLRPVILFTVIISTIGGMSLFTEPEVLFGTTNYGGVGHEALTMSVYQYWQAFGADRFGYGAAVSWVIFFIILLFTFVNWKIVMRDES